jgi:hypothetical protein
VRRWDIAVGVWCVSCVVLSLWTGFAVHRVKTVGDTLLVSSRALETTAAAVHRLAGVPFVGDDLSSLGDQIAQTADSARASGREARASIDSVAITLAVAILVVAVVPPLVVYLALRPMLVAGASFRSLGAGGSP